MWFGGDDPSIQRALVDELQQALRAKEEATSQLTVRSKRMGAARAIAAHRSSIKHRLSGAFSAWLRSVLAMSVAWAVRLNERQLRAAQALAESRGAALVESRAATLAAAEEAKRCAEELSAAKRAATAAEFRRGGDQSRREGLQVAAAASRQSERRMRHSNRVATLRRLLRDNSALSMLRAFMLWRRQMELGENTAIRGEVSNRAAGTGSFERGSHQDRGHGLFHFFGLFQPPQATATAEQTLVMGDQSTAQYGRVAEPYDAAPSSQHARTVTTIARCRLGLLLSQQRITALTRALQRWHRTTASLILRALNHHAKQTHAMLSTERDKVVRGNQKWHAKAKAQLDARASQLSGDRAEVARQRDVLQAEFDLLKRREHDYSKCIAENRHHSAAQILLAASWRREENVMLASLLQWRSAIVVLGECQKADDARAHTEALNIKLTSLESRPATLQGAAEAERRLRLQAEERVQAAEAKVAKLQRECATTPARIARAELASTTAHAEHRERLKAAIHARTSLSRSCKLCATYMWLRVQRRHLISSTLSCWAAIAHELAVNATHAASLATEIKAAERRGYSRALAAALSAERIASAQGKQAEVQQAAFTRQEVAAAWDEVRAMEETREAEATADAAVRASHEARLRHADEQISALNARCQQHEINLKKYDAALEAAKATTNAAVAAAQAEATAAAAKTVVNCDSVENMGGAGHAGHNCRDVVRKPTPSSSQSVAASAASAASAALSFAVAAGEAATAALGKGGDGLLSSPSCISRSGVQAEAHLASEHRGHSTSHARVIDELVSQGRMAAELDHALHSKQALADRARDQMLALGAATAFTVMHATRLTAIACALGKWRHATTSLEGLSILAPLRRQLRGTTALAETRALNARSAFAAELSIAQAEEKHQSELEAARRAATLASRRESAERSRRMAAEHALRKRERAPASQRPSCGKSVDSTSTEMNNVMMKPESRAGDRQALALYAAVNVRAHIIQADLRCAVLLWAAITTRLVEMASLCSMHAEQIEKLVSNRRELATALLDAESARRNAEVAGAESVGQHLARRMAATMAVYTYTRAELAATSRAFCWWARATVGSAWADLAAAVDATHAAATLRLTRRVGSLAATVAVGHALRARLESMASAYTRWQALTVAVAFQHEDQRMRSQLLMLQSHATMASDARAGMARIAEEQRERHAASERIAAAARTSASAKLEAMIRERDEVYRTTKQMEEALVEQKRQHAAAKAEVRGVQERLSKERNIQVKMRITAQRSQLARVVRAASAPCLAACLATWHAASVAEAVSRNYYQSVAIAGNYYYAATCSTSSDSAAHMMPPLLPSHGLANQTQGTPRQHEVQEAMLASGHPTPRLSHTEDARRRVSPPQQGRIVNPANNARMALIAKTKMNRSNRVYAALACVIRIKLSAEQCSLACAMIHWHQATAAMAIEHAAKTELTELSQLMQAAANGRAKTHSALRRAAIHRCLRCSEAVAVSLAIQDWQCIMLRLTLANRISAHEAASTAAALAAAEVARLADSLEKERHLASARPLHVNNQLKAGKEAARASELAKVEAEAKLASVNKAHAAAEAQLRSNNERCTRLLRDVRSAHQAGQSAVLRRVLLATGRYWAPRALSQWRLAVCCLTVRGLPLQQSSVSANADKYLAPASDVPSIASYPSASVKQPHLRPRLFLHARLRGRCFDLLAALHRWRGTVLGLIAGDAAVAHVGRRLADERRVARLRGEVESERKKLANERSEMAGSSAAAAASLAADMASASAEVAKSRRLARRAAATLLSVSIGAAVACATVLRQWRIHAAQLICDERTRGSKLIAESARLEASLFATCMASCLRAFVLWHGTTLLLEASRISDAERVRAAHVSRMLQGARNQLSQRARMPLKLEEDLSSARTALAAEVMRAKEASSQLIIANRQTESAKAQRDAMESDLRRTTAQLRAAQRELTRKVPTADHAAQAGAAAYDDADALQFIATERAASLEAETKEKAEASQKMRQMIACAPHRAAVLVRTLLGLRLSGPMCLLAALGEWRIAAQRRRVQALFQQWRTEQDERERCSVALMRTLTEDLRTTEDDAASAAARMLRRVLDERDQRHAVEKEMRSTVTPLALEEQTNRMREALQLEVLARQAAETKVQRLQRQHAALDSQLRLATETTQRLQREKRASHGASPSRAPET